LFAEGNSRSFVSRLTFFYDINTVLNFTLRLSLPVTIERINSAHAWDFCNHHEVFSSSLTSQNEYFYSPNRSILCRCELTSDSLESALIFLRQSSVIWCK
jgi:hypothetical protein